MRQTQEAVPAPLLQLDARDLNPHLPGKSRLCCH